MARIFTITEGVENMGTLKSGGQGSVYKAKRTGEIISAIKILPTPIHSETEADKNFVAFQNEVQKLKKVNEFVNPNIVTILNSGITETGNFPFIEMEYIDGPDLEELLKPPHDGIFTIHETIKAALHVSHALAHCHKVGIKHGDIKSNNVKFNSRTGNYMLLDFGLSVMSDEQRRTSLRQAGAVEFMAPEQHAGEMSFATEVYSFGIIVFELLAGTVPYPLKENGEAGRNEVIVAQLEHPLPNLLALRTEHLPEWWTSETKAAEMQVPQWLLKMLYKCLEKAAADRFANGMELYDYIVSNSIHAATGTEWGAERLAKLELENAALIREKQTLAQKIASYERSNAGIKNAAGRSWSMLKNIVILLLLGAVTWLIINVDKSKRTIGKLSSPPVTPTAGAAFNGSEEDNLQLKKAKQFLADGRGEESKTIYRALAMRGIPEAMFELGNLTLLAGDRSDCEEGTGYIKKAADKNYLPATRTMGFLYAFAGDSIELQQKGYYGCSFVLDIPKGSKMLMEAALKGDTMASGLLRTLNTEYEKPR